MSGARAVLHASDLGVAMVLWQPGGRFKNGKGSLCDGGSDGHEEFNVSLSTLMAA